MSELTLGSLFDGIGGWLLAAEHSGIEPLWRAEIDDYPRTVSEYHFPSVKSYTDVRGIDGAKAEPVDILCAGSPCQNLSLSGNRMGLKGSESSLFFEAIRIFREMREATNGKKPRFFVWENVCGAFSSNGGHDFRAVLEEITEARIPFPRSHKWIHAGLVRSSKCDAAWRVLDAQYFGVAQRRKRIFLVADFGAEARCAEQILFVEAGMRGNPAAGEGAREGSPEASCRCAYEAGGATVLKIRQPKVKGRGVSGAQYQADQSYTLATNQDQTLFDGREKKPETYVLCSRHSKGFQSDNPYTGCAYASDTTRTLDRQGGNPSCNQGGLLIIDADTKTFSQDAFDKFNESSTSATLKAAGGSYGGGSEALVTHPYCIGNGQTASLRPSEKAKTLNCMHDQQIVVQEKSAPSMPGTTRASARSS